MSNSIAGGGRWPSPKKENGKIVRGKAGSMANNFSDNIAVSTFGPAGNISDQTGISIFDPSLCELIYTWFSPLGATVLDPFAGGSVRGIVASKLGRKYIGVDLRREQIEANYVQADEICEENKPRWICGDSQDIDKLCSDVEADLIFTCPPYGDLEVYSDDPRDISTMDYSKFIASYELILKKAIDQLRADRFAVIVVGEIRDKKTGFYRGFVPDTIRAMESAGAKYYNEMILVTAVGSLPLRAGRVFKAARKIGKTHQNVLVFCKGDPKKAAAYCGDVEVATGADDAIQE